MVPSRPRSRSISPRSARKSEPDPDGGTTAARLRERVEDRLPAPGPVGTVVASALTAAGAKALQGWARSRKPRLNRILRGAAAGAGAAGLVYAARRFVVADAREMDLTDEVLAGAGKGVIYAALVDPLLPGPPLVRGALMGTADYLLAPWGGLISRLQSLSPARKLPLVSTLLETGDAEDDPYVAFLLYGVALAVLHGDEAEE